MSTRIEIRNQFVSLVKTLSDFGDSNVTLYKLDRVDKTPASSIYLGRLNSEPSTMGGDSNDFDRELVIMVDFHSDHGQDADAQTSEWLTQLETAVYRTLKAGEFPEAVEDVFLDFAEFRPTSTAKERKGDLVTIWRVEFEETIAIA